MNKFAMLCVTGVLFFLTVPSVQAADSNWQQANAKIVDARRKGQLAAGARLAEENFQYATQKFGPEHPSTGTSLNNLASLFESMGQYDKALPLYQRALRIAEKAEGPEHPSTATILNNLAGLYESMGQYDEALQLYQRTLRVAEKAQGPEHPSTGTSLNNLANLYGSMGQYDKALPLYQRALVIAHSFGVRADLVTLQGNIAFLHSSLKQPDLAIYFGKAAVNTMQSLRASNVALDAATHQALLKTQLATCELVAQWLIEAGRLSEAEQVLAMLKEDELSQCTRRRAEAGGGGSVRASFNGPETQINERVERSMSELGQLALESSQLRKVRPTERTPAQQERLSLLSDQFTAQQQLFTELPILIQQEVQSAQTANRTRVEQEALTARSEIRNLLIRLQSEGSPRAAILHYLVTEKQVYVLVTMPELQKAIKLDLGAHALSEQINQARALLQQPLLDPLPALQALHQKLFAPVAEILNKASVQHVMISSTDSLRYLPFAALHDGKQYLIERYQLSMMTEAASPAGIQRPKGAWTVAAMGVSNTVSSEFEPLPAVVSELQGIVRSASNSAGALAGELYLNQNFTAKQYSQVIAQGPSVIHLATHFKFDLTDEARSYMLLGDGKNLSLREMFHESYRFRNLELLTLSACETALSGGQRSNGRDFESFGAQAQRNGAQAVIATLWQVADNSTGELMQRFYAARELAPQETKAESVRKAQVALIEGRHAEPTSANVHATAAAAARAPVRVNRQGGVTAKAYVPQKDKPYAHPYYWAPFVLMGNWL